MKITNKMKQTVAMISRAWKAVVAGVGALATALAPIIADDVIGWDEAGGVVSALVIAVSTVAAVWATPNRPAPQPQPQSHTLIG